MRLRGCHIRKSEKKLPYTTEKLRNDEHLLSSHKVDLKHFQATQSRGFAGITSFNSFQHIFSIDKDYVRFAYKCGAMTSLICTQNQAVMLDLLLM